MPQQTLARLADIIKYSKEPIQVDLQEGRLILKTNKGSFDTLCALIGIAFGLLLIIAKDRAQNNLSLGLVIFFLSIALFWRLQRINKTLIIDLNNQSFSMIPNLSIVRWTLTHILRLDLVCSIDKLADVERHSYHKVRYSWTERVYLEGKFVSICLLEFADEKTASKVLALLEMCALVEAQPRSNL